MRILVTGGAGYIGSHAVRLFVARGHDVWVYDNLSFGHRTAVPAERLVVADLGETARLDQVLLEKRIEAVVHFAAWTFVGESVRDLDPAKLLPAKRSYYEFEGSLTTPPCSEGVRWLVLKEPVTLSRQQLDAFRKLYPRNARPTQPLNSRTVRESAS